MLRINQIKLNADTPQQNYEEKLRDAIAKALRVGKEEISDIQIIRRSLDARKKPELFYSFLVDFNVKNESTVMKKAKGNKVLSNNLKISDGVEYKFPYTGDSDEKIVIIGSGPAGLFCGLYLARAGFKPIILERGEDVDKRTETVSEFWKTGKLNTASNVQFGEGGAGTFSDGKLNTLIKDTYGLNRVVMSTFTEFGADSSILYDAKPHIGTDVLKNVVKNIREEIIALGGKVIFNTCVDDFVINDNKITSVKCSDGNEYECTALVLAIGHSARDTFKVLYDKSFSMEQKPFAVGLRVQHKQSMINKSQYGRTEAGDLGTAAYKVTARSESGRGVFSFCMCPGGYVVNASSEDGMTAVNGMSYNGRAGENANSAIIISVNPSDFESDHPLAGIEFQRKMERKAFEIADGCVPVQRYGAFKSSVIDDVQTDNEIYCSESELKPEIKGLYKWCELSKVMPQEFNHAFVEGMESFDRSIHGFANDDVILAGIESRTSSPVRIVRDERYISNIEGVFPCGEGAGYAGGITSAAIDGIKVAEAVAAFVNQLN
ncbi:MAG: NAD(P)/FAD-dependent oxidoreductase [Lachnospiraceae bacterium]|nr:NAD(P)/FAD-dependent oxidoreductase [Lachnospiraceae bacterium]